VSVGKYAERFEPLIQPDEVLDAVHMLLNHHPVVHTEADGGFWVVSKYADCMRLLRENENFRVGAIDGRKGCRIPADPEGIDRPTMPPLDSNPPIQRHFRGILNPFLTPKALESIEPGIRRCVDELINRFADDGHCDLALQLSKVFPATVLFRELFQIEDEAELEKCRVLVRRIVYGLFKEDPQVISELQQEFDNWIHNFVNRRREEPRGNTIIDALLTGRVDGRPLTQSEIVGAVEVLILGGFGTTADGASNAVVALIDYPEVEQRLRDDPALIQPFVEEVLRMEPPVTARARAAVRDVEVGGHVISAGERILVNFTAANRDPDVFDHPDVFDLDRIPNRHLSFAGGIHRCIGSTFARMMLRVMVEELLARIKNIQFASDERETRVCFGAGGWRSIDNLPVVFESTSLRYAK
jgi:cytochrome P450